MTPACTKGFQAIDCNDFGACAVMIDSITSLALAAAPGWKSRCQAPQRLIGLSDWAGAKRRLDL